MGSASLALAVRAISIPAGGMIDIARIEHDVCVSVWRLYSKNHANCAWVLQAEGRLHELLDLLKADPGRVFWQ